MKLSSLNIYKNNISLMKINSYYKTCATHSYNIVIFMIYSLLYVSFRKLSFYAFRGDIPSRGDIITADNLHITTAYPQPIGRTGSLVAVYAIVQHDNQLCPHGSNRERRDVSEHDGTLSRSRRALEPVGNTTYSILDHSILEAVLNDSETWITIQQVCKV